LDLFFESLGQIKYSQIIETKSKYLGGKHGTIGEKFINQTQKKIDRQMKEIKRPLSVLIQQLELWGSQILCLKDSKKSTDLTSLSLLKSASEWSYELQFAVFHSSYSKINRPYNHSASHLLMSSLSTMIKMGSVVPVPSFSEVENALLNTYITVRRDVSSHKTV
jgi:hypothetical protein